MSSKLSSEQILRGAYNETSTALRTTDAVAVTTLLSAVTSTGAGTASSPDSHSRTFQATGTTSAGSGAATVKVQVSNDNSNWIDLGTITLVLGTSATSDGFSSDAAWKYVRGNVTAISGTNATVSLYMGA